VGEEADDAAVVDDDGDVEGLGGLKQSVGPEIGDDGEAGDAVAVVTNCGNGSDALAPHLFRVLNSSSSGSQVGVVKGLNFLAR